MSPAPEFGAGGRVRVSLKLQLAKPIGRGFVAAALTLVG
jgi:hypothetical protein